MTNCSVASTAPFLYKYYGHNSHLLLIGFHRHIGFYRHRSCGLVPSWSCGLVSRRILGLVLVSPSTGFPEIFADERISNVWIFLPYQVIQALPVREVFSFTILQNYIKASAFLKIAVSANLSHNKSSQH